MKYIDMVRKVVKFLRTTKSYKKGGVYFVPSTYDKEEDMPHITYDDGERVAVSYAEISEDGDEVYLTFLRKTKDGCGSIMIALYKEEDAERECNAMGLEEVLMEMFYYTNESCKYKDFEDMLNKIE